VGWSVNVSQLAQSHLLCFMFEQGSGKGLLCQVNISYKIIIH